MRAAEAAVLERLGVDASRPTIRAGTASTRGADRRRQRRREPARCCFGSASARCVSTGFVSLGYRALREFSRRDLEEICRRRGKPDRFGEILQQHDDVALGVEIVGNLAAALGARRRRRLGRRAMGITRSTSRSRGAVATALALGLVLVMRPHLGAVGRRPAVCRRLSVLHLAAVAGCWPR